MTSWEKLGLDVSKLDYFFQKPGMNLDEGLVRLFDNNSSMEMAEIGVKAGLIDLYAVEVNGVVDMGGGANEVPVSQLTQEHIHSHVGGKAAREIVFEEPQDGLTASDSDDDGDAPYICEDGPVDSDEGEDDGLVDSDEGEDDGLVDSDEGDNGPVDGDDDGGKRMSRYSCFATMEGCCNECLFLFLGSVSAIGGWVCNLILDTVFQWSNV